MVNGIADEGIPTVDLWCQKQQLYQLRHNYYT